MPQPMSALLTRIPNVTGLTPAAFSALFADSDFDGTASNDEMTKFAQLAWRCVSKSSKGVDRVTAVFNMGLFIGMPPSHAFPRLNLNVVIYQMLLRLLKPERINQKNFGLCGPAHFLILLLKSKPDQYVRMARELLSTGKTTADDGSEVIPDDYVCAYDPTGNIPEADWLLAASLRNAKTPIPLGKEGSYMGTNAAEVYAYCLHAGYGEVLSLACHGGVESLLAYFVIPAQFKPESVRKDIERITGTTDFQEPSVNVRLASRLRADGWRVLMQINSKLLTVTPPDDMIRRAAKDTQDPLHTGARQIVEQSWNPIVSKKSYFLQNTDHWVLLKKMSVERDQVSLRVYTWGTQKEIKGTVPLEEFRNAYSGFVAARG